MQESNMTKELTTQIRKAASSANLGLWQEVITQGYILIDTVYQPHPIKRPFDLVHKIQTRRWWAKQVRESSQQLAVAMMQASIDAFGKQLKRPFQEEDFDFRERQRQRQITFDIDQQIRLAEAQGTINAKTQGDLQQQQANLNRPPNLKTWAADYFAQMAEIEKDPNLTQDEKDRRLGALRDAQGWMFGNGPK